MKTKSLPKLSRSLVSKYNEMQKLSEEINLHRATAEKLDQQRKPLAKQLEEVFQDKAVDNQMRLDADTILQRKVIEVQEATIVRKGYSYSRWSQLQL